MLHQLWPPILPRHSARLVESQKFWERLSRVSGVRSGRVPAPSVKPVFIGKKKGFTISIYISLATFFYRNTVFSELYRYDFDSWYLTEIVWLFSVKSHWALDAHFMGLAGTWQMSAINRTGSLVPSAVENGCSRRFWQNSQDWMIWITTKFGMLVYIVYIYVYIYTKCGFNRFNQQKMWIFARSKIPLKPSSWWWQWLPSCNQTGFGRLRTIPMNCLLISWFIQFVDVVI